MKRIIFSWLTCSIYFSAFAQIDTSKKINPGNSENWETIKGNGKSSTGKLFVTLPKGTEWDMTIYAAGTTKVLSNTSLKTSLILPPGKYDLEINHIWIKGVPVEKGNSTRIKAGVLKITASDAWTLYDKTKETVLINTYSAQNRGLPIGKYVLRTNGSDEFIEIKDELGYTGETNNPYETSQYVLTPTSGNEEGSIVTSFPMASNGMNMIIVYTLLITKQGESNPVFSCNGSSSFDHCPETYSLPEGIYNIYFGIKGESYANTNQRIAIQNVPVKKGYKTRLKVGYLHHKFRGIYKVFDESMQVNYLSYNFQLSPPPIPLPVGNYTIHMPNAGNYKVQIKDGIKTEQAPEDFSKKPRWTITPILKTVATPVNIKSGRIISEFPGSDTLKFILHMRQPNGTVYNVTLDTLKYYDTKPGIYTADLNNDLIEFPVEQGKQTRIKFGFMNLGAGTWSLQDLSSGKVFNYGIHAGLHKRALPVGLYVFKYDNKYYLLKINEGETSVPVMSY
jgi:hypothetical protein